MTRLFCLTLVVALAGFVPIKAQEKKDPPKDFTNSIGMKFVWIKPGSFMMGSPKEEKAREDIEVQHKVTLTRGYYLGVYLVTQEEWQAVMGNNPSNFKGEKNLPADSVSWGDCQGFVKRLREKDKKPYRLPTESEWEYACRAGTTTPFYFGQSISSDQANYNGNKVYGNGKKGMYREKTTPVGSFPANAWGLHDMYGNVWEWCQDWYGDYPKKDVIDPKGPPENGGGGARVLRGGSWCFNPQDCRSARRYGFNPRTRFDDYGLRVCFSLEQEAKPNDMPKEAEADKEQPLTVTINLQKNPIRANKPFVVDLRVVNSSKTPQSFQVMIGSSYKHWHSSNERVQSYSGWPGKRDVIVTLKLAPGKAYEKTLSMWLNAGMPQEKVSFKMGFTPFASEQTFWSKEVTLQVDDEETAKELDGASGIYDILQAKDARLHWVIGAHRELEAQHESPNISIKDDYQADLELPIKRIQKFPVQITYGWSVVWGSRWQFLEVSPNQVYSFRTIEGKKGKSITVECKDGKKRELSASGQIEYKNEDKSELTETMTYPLPKGVREALLYTVQETALVQYLEGNNLKTYEKIYLPKTQRIGFYVYVDETGDLYRRNLEDAKEKTKK